MTVLITARGFAANDKVALSFDDSSYVFATLPCDSQGRCAGKAEMPTPGVQGEHTLHGVGIQPNESAQVTMIFMPFVPPLQGAPGGRLTYYGSSFAANETVNIYWGTEKGTAEGSATANSSGAISFQITAPANVTVGNYPLTIVRSQQKPATIKTYYRVPPPDVTLNTGGILSGQSVTITAVYFRAGEQVAFSWNANGGQTLATVTANSAGRIRYTLAPPSAPKGSYTITATGASSGLKARTTLNIGPGLRVEPDAGVNPGGSFTVNGGGFSSNESLQVYFQDPANGSITVTTDGNGAFSAKLTAPKQYDANTTYYVYAANTTKTEEANVQVRFVQPGISRTDIYGGGEYFPYGSPIVISGQGFLSGESVDIYWNYQQASQIKVIAVQAASDGTFSITITAPSTPGSGGTDTYATIAAVGETSQLQAVLSQVDVSTGESLTPDHGPAGTSVTVTGGNFATNAQITIVLRTSIGSPGGNPPSDDTVLATTTTDSTGAFSVTVAMPAVTSTTGLVGVLAEVAGRSFAASEYTYTTA
jgi:hypothetical protein